MIEAYPLQWPGAWPRTEPSARKNAKFGVRATNEHGWHRLGQLTIAEASGRIVAQLRQFGVPREDLIISTNLRLRIDGLPYSSQAEPADPGAALYWNRDGKQQCLAIDRYDRIADNLGAIAATVDALRAIERHGGAQILERAFVGLKALPASTQPVMTTQEAAKRIVFHAGGDVAKILADRAEAVTRVRAAIARVHPDKNNGSSTEGFLLVNEAKRILALHHGGTL